jgi:hypothetical protein
VEGQRCGDAAVVKRVQLPGRRGPQQPGSGGVRHTRGSSGVCHCPGWYKAHVGCMPVPSREWAKAALQWAGHRTALVAGAGLVAMSRFSRVM